MPKKGDNLDQLSAAASIDHHGITVKVHPQTDLADDMQGVFDIPYIETADFAGSMPRLLVESTDMTAHKIRKGTVFDINGDRYSVAWPPQPDGTGLTELWLHKA